MKYGIYFMYKGRNTQSKYSKIKFVYSIDILNLFWCKKDFYGLENIKKCVTIFLLWCASNAD